MRPFWSGTISFGLVSVPVALWPANRSGGLSLRMLAPDGTPLERRYHCPKEGRGVPREEIVRGYELDDGRYVVVEDEELEALAPERSRDIDLRRFVDREALDPAFFQRAYFLTPSGDSAKAYRLLAAAMEDEGKAGVATFVMRGKEYLVAILAEDGILRAETLRFADEIRDPEAMELPSADDGKGPPAEEVKRFAAAIRELHAADIDRDELVDRDAERLREVLEAKAKAGEDVVEVDEAEAGRVVPIGDHVDLMAAIKASLEGARADGGGGGPRRQGGGSAKRKGKGAGSRRRRSGEASAGEDLSELTKDELYARAQEVDLPGRSSMTKAELARALATR